MKCEFCAGDISINDKRCPHCDAENKYFKAHREEMAAYAKRFEATREEVEKKTTRITSRALSITIIAVEALVALILIIVLANMRDINYNREYKKNTRNAKSIAKILGKYEADGDYYQLSAYFNSFDVKTYQNELSEYNVVTSVASSYKSIFETIHFLALEGGGNDSDSDIAKRICRNLDSIYTTRFDYFDERQQRETYASNHLEAMDDMISEIFAMLKTYLGLSDEEIDGIWDMTSSERQLVLEKRIAEVRTNVEE